MHKLADVNMHVCRQFRRGCMDVELCMSQVYC